MATILVDADACPVKDIIERIAKKEKVDLHYFTDINHRIESQYGQVHILDQGSDMVDLAIVNYMKTGDVIVSQDYGVATMVLAKGGYVVHPSGRVIDNGSIEELMFARHIAREERLKRRNKTTKHKKRKKEDDQLFQESLEYVLALSNTRK